MPIVNGRNLPDSISAVSRRATDAASVTLIINPRVPTQDNPSRFEFANRTVIIGNYVQTRRMVLKSNPQVFFEFDYPPVQVGYDGMGVELVEIPRPILAPIVEVKGSKNYKAVFEFLVAQHFDGLVVDIEKKLKTLEWMANKAEPVYFENFDNFLIAGFWYIGEFSIKVTRVNTDGKIVAAQCNIGLIEHRPVEKRFASLPRIKYTTRRSGRGGGGPTTAPGTDANPDTDAARAVARTYEFRRTTPPPFNETEEWTKTSDAGSRGRPYWKIISDHPDLLSVGVSMDGVKTIETTK
jgi:hypothetical protein